MRKEKLRLSHSAIDKFKTCGRMFDLHYNQRIRSRYLNSPLFFGSAIDEALNRLLIDKKDELTEYEEIIKTKTAAKIFEEKMLKTPHNNEIINIPRNPLIKYYKSDFTPEILTESDAELILDEGLDIEELNNFMSDKDSPIEKVNYIYWVCLYRKGLMMLDAYKRDLLPRIIKVHKIQSEVNLENSEGDILRGYVDFVATLDDGIKYTVDNKTSSRPYKKDSVKNSPQLTIYSEWEETTHACHMVLEKRVRKRKPHIKTQDIRDEIKENQRNQVFTDIDEALHDIREKKFDPNWNSCYNFGGCPYLKYCKSGLRNTEDLVHLEVKDERKERK